MAKESIENKILKYMLDGNRINQWNSYELFQYTRLSATIFNLRARGYIIQKEWKKTLNGKRYKEYWLSDKDVSVQAPDKPKKEEDVQEGFGFKIDRKFEWPD